MSNTHPGSGGDPGRGEFVDALVVGSGFGGSVAAYRWAAAGKSVVVMERGRPYPPGSFARSPAEMGRNFWDPSEAMYGLFDAWTFRGMEGVVSSGLGGGSLIYANVLLRKDPQWFVHHSPLPGGGYEHWPFSRADLEPHYDNVEQMLQPVPYPYLETLKTKAMKETAEALGLEYQRPPIAVAFAGTPGGPVARQLPIEPAAYGNLHGASRFTCVLCGECDIGCNLGAKQTLDHTYLSAAQHDGADIRTLHEVRGIRPLPEGGYEVRYVVHTDDGQGASTRSLPEQLIRCGELILAAGTFGTTFLLLRSRASLPGLSRALGSRFSGNGDLLTLLMGARTQDGRPRLVNANSGPVITSAIRVPDRADGDEHAGRGYYIEDAGYPAFANWLVESGQLRAVTKRTLKLAQRLMLDRLLSTQRSNISADVAAVLGDGRLSSSSLPLLGMGRDIPDGMMSLKKGRLAINWTLATSTDYFSSMRQNMMRMADHLGADFHDNPLWWTNRVITVHPLGGAPSGRHAGEGVCDSFGEVFGHPGLHVLDGSAMPGPVGANPALTIAAFSDRACDRMLSRPQPARRVVPGTGNGTAPAPAVEREEAELMAPQDSPESSTSPAVTSVRFTEQMAGPLTLGVSDPRKAAALARTLGHSLMFELTIATGPIEDFLADPLRGCDAVGYVSADVLGGRLPVERGWFNLFVREPDSDGRRMRYRLWFRDAGGTPLTLVGYKKIDDDPGPDLWRDTTTLYTQVLPGHVPVGESRSDTEAVAAGIISITPLSFARQLTTFRGEGPGGLLALARFAKLFLGELWDVYLRPVSRRRRVRA